ncbi:MAG: O-antigen ligase family protein [Acidobacteria bacterium]|nr:O-antigen ligase family protein [Acidobacteriota bacterium]
MAFTTATATSRLESRPPRRSRLQANIVGLTLVVLLAPVVALIASSAEVIVVAGIAAAIALLLVVLWSAEATFYVLVFSMLLSPEFIVGDLAGTSATAVRGITLRLDDCVIVIIALAWLVRLAVYKEAALFRRTPLNGPIIAYLGFSALVTLFGALMGRLNLMTGSFYVLKYVEYTVIYFLVVNYVRDRDQIRRLLYAALVTAVIIAVIGMSQIPFAARVSAPFEGEHGEPNTLGGYLVLMMALSLAFLGAAKNGAERSRWVLATCLMMVPLAFTYSRTSWLAFCAMLIATIALSRRKAIFFLLISVFLVLMVVSPPEALIERATYTLSAQRGSIEFLGYTIEPSAAARLEAWVIAATSLIQYPLTGAGVTGAGLIDAQYPRVIAESGLIGFALFIWLIIRLAGTGFRLRRVSTTRIETILANGFIAGLIGILVHGIGANTFIIVRIMEPMWLLAGLVGAALLLREEEDSTVGAPAPIDARLSAPQIAS